MNKKVFILILCLGIAVVGWYGFSSLPSKTILPQAHISPSASSKAVDYAAGFAIVTHGTFRIFTAAMYHNLSPDVYIQADNPNIIHVKKSGTTWNDFFKTLPFQLSRDCLTTGTGQTFCTGNNGSLRFYLNGVLDQDALGKPIGSGDQLLVSFGNENDEQIQQQLRQIPVVR